MRVARRRAARTLSLCIVLALLAGCSASHGDRPPAAASTPATTAQPAPPPDRLQRGDGDPAAEWQRLYRQGDAALGATPDVAAATAWAEAALDRATAAGYDARGVVFASGAVEIHLRFRSDADYFAPPRSDWIALVFDEAGITRRGVLLVVEAPDGSPTFVAGHGVCYADCAMPATSPGTPLADAARARTRLSVVVRDIGDRRPPIDVDVCGPGAATGELCDALGIDRYGLVPPQASDTSCSGVPSPTVEVRGAIDGVALDQQYGTCTDGTVQRWIRLLTDAGAMPAGWMGAEG